MKIAMIGHKRIPGREGGIETVVEELSTRLVMDGHKVTAYNRHKKGQKNYKSYKGVKIIDIPTIPNKKTDAVCYAFLASLHALFGKYDIYHYHAIGPSFFIIIPKLFRKKVVVTVHGLNYKTPKWKGFAAKFIQMGEKITAKYADSIIVLSEEQKKYFKQKYNRETIYIPNGTNVRTFYKADEIKKRYNLDKNKYILFLSRVVPGKGVEYLLDAYRNVKSDMRLIIAGETEYLSDYRKKIEEKASLDKRVELIGFVEGQVLEELYCNARLFVFPSEAEGMPMCLLEAMSYNCPCLVSNIPENLEVGKDFVTTFKSCDTEDLRRKLECVLSAKEKKLDSRSYIQENYSWEKVVKKTEKCYEELLCH